MLDYNVYLNQMLERIERMKKTDWKNLEKDDLILDATILRLQVLGESSSKISDKMRKKYSHIDWKSLIKTRDFISHHYERVDPAIVGEFVLNKILPMEDSLKKILKEENKE